MVYKKMYLHLFRRVTEIIEFLERAKPNPDKDVKLVLECLKGSQIECEEIYIDFDEEKENEQ